MSAERLTSRVESFSDKLDAMMIRLDKMKDSFDDLVAKGEELDLPYDDQYERRSKALSEAAKLGRSLSWKLVEISGMLFDAGRMADDMASHYWEARRLPKDHVGPA